MVLSVLPPRTRVAPVAAAVVGAVHDVGRASARGWTPVENSAAGRAARQHSKDEVPSKLTDRAILVVGASSGAGAEAAVRRGRRRNRIGLVARRADRLEAVADRVRADGSSCHTWVADVSDPEAANAVPGP
ncbi:SDR family NAD(P)-dependent oxidoreductase [Streptomyces sp. NPDC090493]|uniref:SDR family NAD(P)-dependent oxidoreductase n=1 Tax=Streptomyces sp. NPDC090493 TaxID=3365964 RepID=UPI003815D316